jgi:hypothetical protein
MRTRSDTHGSVLQVRAFYSIGALAHIGNVSTYMLRRLLRANGVVFLRGQRAIFVPLTEIREKVPPLWKAICLVAELQAARGQTGTLVRPVPDGAGKKLSP